MHGLRGDEEHVLAVDNDLGVVVHEASHGGWQWQGLQLGTSERVKHADRLLCWQHGENHALCADDARSGVVRVDVLVPRDLASVDVVSGEDGVVLDHLLAGDGVEVVERVGRRVHDGDVSAGVADTAEVRRRGRSLGLVRPDGGGVDVEGVASRRVERAHRSALGGVDHLVADDHRVVRLRVEVRPEAEGVGVGGDVDPLAGEGGQRAVGEDGLVDVPNLRQRSWRGRVGVGRLCGRLWGVRKACVGRLTSGASPEVTQIRSPVWMSYAATADSTPA